MRHNLFASVCLLLSALVLSRAGAVDKSADVRFFNASNADNVDDISSSFHSRTLLSAARRPIGEGGAEAVEAPPNLIHGHIIPHSHCDPGWLQTFEGYYQSDVKNIITGVVNALNSDPEKRFVWSETVFFQRWYELQSVETKNTFKRLLMTGQWEFVGGGWVQNDEANPSLYGIVNQMTSGHEYLLQNFGIQPRIAWQLDPFGHSSVSPTLFALMGFDALVINRIHFSEKDNLKSKNFMEFIWRGANVGVNVDMLTHVLHTHYSAPKGFDWEDGAPAVGDYNVDERATTLCNEVKARSAAYRSRHVLIPFGDDFKFRNPSLQFGNMDQIIRRINKDPQRFGCTMSYSTAGEYFTHVHQTRIDFPLYDADFFPYADNGDSYWTGYFTTRPFLKIMARRVDAELHAADILFALARSSHSLVARALTANEDKEGKKEVDNEELVDVDNLFERLLAARQNAALFLHHDAITGTARRATNDDYMRRMTEASNNLQHVMAKSTEYLLSKQGLLHAESGNKRKAKVSTAALQVDSENRMLDFNEKRAHTFVLFNPLGWPRCELVVLKVKSSIVYVTDAQGKPVLAQVESNPEDSGDHHSDASIEQLVSRDSTPNAFRLLFSASLPALGFATYYVHVFGTKPTESSFTNPAVVVKTEFFQPGLLSKIASIVRAMDADPPVIQNDLVAARISPSSGLLDRMTDKVSGHSKTVEHLFKKYSTSSSGAYLFRPIGSNNIAPAAGELLVRVYKGPVAQTISSRFGSFDTRMRVVLPKTDGTAIHETDIEQRSAVDSWLSLVAPSNNEIVSLYNTDIANQGIFYTNNGLQWTPREFLPGTPIASNFYPMVSAARIQDKEYQLSIVTAHAVACGSLGVGQMELMVHRNLQQDDGRGLGEPINDNSRADVQLRLLFSSVGKGKSSSAALDLRTRRASIRLDHPVQVMYGETKQLPLPTKAEWEARYITSSADSALISKPLPDHVHLFGLAVRDGISDDIIIRLQGMSASHNTAAKLSLSNLLSLPARATRVRELTLSQNHVLERNEFPKQRWHFPYARNSLVSFSEVDYKKVLSTGGESQNTEEAGVFISSHALEHSTAAPARKLLQAKDDGDWSVVEVNPLGLRTYAFNLAPDAERLAQVLAFLKASELFRLVSSVKSALALPSRKVHAILVEQISSQSRRLVPGTSLAVKKPTQSASAIQVTAALIETKHDVASAKSISTALRVDPSDSTSADFRPSVSTLHNADLLPQRTEFMGMLLLCVVLVLVAVLVLRNDGKSASLPRRP